MDDRTPDTAPDALRTLERRAALWTAVCVASGVIAFTGNFLPDDWLGIPALGFAVFLVTMWPAYRFRKAHALAVRRRETQPLPVERLTAFEAPPVLYLRSFEDDERAGRIKGEWTEEEHLRSVLSQFGPFVAIGRPGESVPTAGAARVYVGDEHWQATVERLLGTARLVVLRTGATRGLHWEIERAVRLVPPDRLLLVVDDRRELRALLATARAVHAHVPARLWVGWRSIGSIKGFVVFDDRWTPTVLRARGAGWYHFYDNAPGVGFATKRLAWTLRPLFHRLGEPWTRPPLNWGFIVLGGLSAALFVAAIVLTLLGS